MDGVCEEVATIGKAMLSLRPCLCEDSTHHQTGKLSTQISMRKRCKHYED